MDMTNSIEKAESIELVRSRFAGFNRVVENQGHKVRVFTGIDVNYARAVMDALLKSGPKEDFQAPRYQELPFLTGEQSGIYSIFSDGSLLFLSP